MLEVLRKEYDMIKDSKRKVHQVTEKYISPNYYCSIPTTSNTKEEIWYDTGITYT